MHNALIDYLSRYVPVTDQDAGTILALFTSRKFRKHQFILQEGDVARFESFVVRGLTRTYEIDAKGREHVIQFGLEDWWIGDLASFLAGTPSTYAIDCLEDTEILQISRPNLNRLYETVPSMERCFRIIIQN